MIGTVFQISLLRLWNNKQELLLALVVPMLFFSIFALIFGRGMGDGTAAIKVAVVDDDGSTMTAEIVRFLREQPAIEMDLSVLRTSDKWPLKRLAKAVLGVTRTDIVIYLPADFERRLQSQTEVAVQLFSEGTNPVGSQIVTTLLSQVAGGAAARSLPAIRHRGASERPSAASRDRPSGLHPTEAKQQPSPLERSAGRIDQELISFETTDVFAATKHNPKIAMYAAGIAVMFLLFSATGAGGSLLEEYEAGTLDRLLTSRLSVTELLAGKWLFITCLGCVQLTVMFSWAQLVFGVDLLGHIKGFAVMTLCTAAATASLALCLAVLCRSRAQLNGVSIVLILTMSALGGSMIPRYIMSDEMQRWGLLTFNAWALDGYKKVFWYDLPISALTQEIQVLLAMAVALAGFARMLADRWAAD